MAHSSIIVALFACIAASCSDDDGRESALVCRPGEQIACACPAGKPDGVRVCDLGGIFGVCEGCGVVTDPSTDPTTTDSDTTMSTTDPTDVTMTTSIETSGPGADSGEVTGPPGGTDTGGNGFAWVWVDHGGPAFLPPPCAASAGVADGVLVDPQAFFDSLVAGADPDDWVNVMNAIEPQLWACGIGQQRDSGGNVRGRLFLPTDACPDASPPADDPNAMFLGVRQERACWTHPVDVVAEL